MKLVTPILVVLSFLALSRPAVADDRWDPRVDHVRASRTGLKVIMDNDGYQATVAIGSDVVSDSVPAMFNLPDGDGFYMVTIKAPSGAQWQKKIEAKRFFTTELRITHTAGEEPKAKASGRKFIGKATNRVTDCGRGFRYVARFDFVNADGDVKSTMQAHPGDVTQASVPAGTYDVRAYVWDDKKQTWAYQLTTQGEVGRDNWSTALTCKDKGLLGLKFTK